jgi:hypothetical protein
MYNDDFKYKTSQYFMQEMGGSRWGTEMARVNQTMNQGVMTVHSALQLQKYGLVDYGGKIDKKNVRDVASNHMLGGNLWKTNPFEAVMVWQDQLLKKIPSIAAIKDPNERYKAEAGVFNKIGFNMGTTDAIVKMIMSQDMLRKKEFPMFNQTPGLKQALPTSEKSSIVQQASLQAQYNTALIQLGQQALPLATKGMVFLTGMLTKVNEFLSTEMGRNTAKLIVAATAATAFVGGLLAIGAPLALMGMLASTVGASVGGVVAGIVAATGITTLVILRLMTSGKATALALQQAWTSIVASSSTAMIKFAQTVGTGLNNILRPITTFLSNLVPTVATGLNRLLSPIAAFFGRVAQYIGGLVSNPIGAIAGAADAGARALAGSINGNIAAGSNPVNNPMAKTPNYVKPQTAKGGPSNKIGPISMTVHQQPGQDAFDLAKKVISMLNESIHHGLTSTSSAGGIYESPWHQGGEIG